MRKEKLSLKECKSIAKLTFTVLKPYLFILLCLGCTKSDTITLPVIVEKNVNVKDFGAKGNGIDNDTKAFQLAMNAADSLNLKLFVPLGKYPVDLVLNHDNIRIEGEQQPTENFDNGTIILGKINCNRKKNISISNLGVDARNQLGPSDDAAVTSGIDADSIVLHQVFKGISIIGDGYFSYKHGILCQSGSGIVIKNVNISNFYHGIAIRSSNVVVDTAQINYCGFTSIVIKSTNNFNIHTENVLIDHITIKGDAKNLHKKGGCIMIMSSEDKSMTNNVTIQNVNSTYGGYSCITIQEIMGLVKNVTIQNCYAESQGDDTTRACYDINGGSNILFSNCTTRKALGYGFRSTANAINNIKVLNSFEINSNKGAWTGNYTSLQLNGKVIIK